MTRPSTTVRVIATITSLAYAIALYLSGVHLQGNVKDAVGYIPTVATLLVAMWDIWLWRLPGFQRVARRPWLTGLWSATLLPTEASQIPSGGNRGPITAFVVIKQSFWSVAVRQYTAESRSDSLATAWGKTSGGDRLTFTYENQPRQQLEARSSRHLGTTALDVVGLRPNLLQGEYFTDRYTKGDMELRLVDRVIGDADFASAKLHFERADLKDR